MEFVLQVHNPRIVQCTIDKQLRLTIHKEQTAVPFYDIGLDLFITWKMNACKIEGL